MENRSQTINGIQNDGDNFRLYGLAISQALIDSEKILRVTSLSEITADEELSLRKQILAGNPELNDVEFNIKQDSAAQKSLKKDTVSVSPAITDLKTKWHEVIDALDKTRPYYAALLRSSKRVFTGNSLTIQIPNGNLYQVNANGIDKIISDLFREIINESVSVKFVPDTDARPESPISSIADVNVSPKKPTNEQIHEQPIKRENITAERKSNAAPNKQSPAYKTSRLKIDHGLTGDFIPLSTSFEPDNNALIRGEIAGVNIKETQNDSIIINLCVTDYDNSIWVKFFAPQIFFKNDLSFLKKGVWIAAMGKISYNSYLNDIVLEPSAIGKTEPLSRIDTAQTKRVELHLHTQMSAADGVTHIEKYVKTAKSWGMNAIAVTDHGVLQAFPDAHEASKKHGIKIIYGIEGYMYDDLSAVSAVLNVDLPFTGEFIVFDIETTGLTKDCHIIEIGAVRLVNLEITETFSTLINPGTGIPYNITELTGIDDNLVKDAPNLKEALDNFLDFIGSSPLIAHNAEFDMGFLVRAINAVYPSPPRSVRSFPVIDTLPICRALYGTAKKHTLAAMTELLGITNSEHHRALADAHACAEIFIKTAAEFIDRGVKSTRDINNYIAKNIPSKTIKRRHVIILVKNMTGLRNLYELVSEAHLKFFYMRPRIPKSRLTELRDGLIIGSACDGGEIFQAFLSGADEDRITELANFYDYYEVQPADNSMHLVRSGELDAKEDIIAINKRIVSLGEKYGKPVCATSDAHYLDLKEGILRKILRLDSKYKDVSEEPPLYMRTTDEMLSEFMYMGAEKAYEIVVENTNLIADMTEPIVPIPQKMHAPLIKGADEEIAELAMSSARKIYGKELPPIILDRLQRELDAIIKNGFAVMYLVAHKLVKHSEKNGYLVGSRGSVGSSLAATMTGITEVNPLPPHYLCPACQFSDFESDIVLSYAGGSGCDMPDRYCPVCGTPLIKDGHDIPFETFLGFDGNKEPDIDLNFSGEFQAAAHTYTEELFGEGFVYKAGTIGTYAEKNAHAAVKKYMDNQPLRNAEAERLKQGLIGAKKTTGQHPGGLIIVPKELSIYDFTPVQKPANADSKTVITTHFDFGSIQGALLKLDILGHDAPTILKILQDYTGVDPRLIDIGSLDVISLFSSPDALNVSDTDIDSKTGSLGLPEFGTSFVRQMLVDTQPSTFSELVRISGLSHGTDVWYNNAKDLIKSGKATLKTIIPTRDDIFLYFISKGVDKKAAFAIAERVRKGQGLGEGDEKILTEQKIPKWYIESCEKIKYLFPKAHAVAYVMMTMRIGYFKLRYPLEYYAAIWSVRTDDFDYEICCCGLKTAGLEITRINALTKDNFTQTEKNALSLLETVREFYARGFLFAKLDLYKADAEKFTVTDGHIMPPLCTISGLGLGAAKSVVAARTDGEFSTVEDFRVRTKVNKTVIEVLKNIGVLDGMPETDQMTLF